MREARCTKKELLHLNWKLNNLNWKLVQDSSSSKWWHQNLKNCNCPSALPITLRLESSSIPYGRTNNQRYSSRCSLPFHSQPTTTIASIPRTPPSHLSMRRLPRSTRRWTLSSKQLSSSIVEFVCSRSELSDVVSGLIN